MTNPATANLACKRPDHQFFTYSSSASTAASYGAGSLPGIGAYETAENPSLTDYSEVHASGIIIRSPREEGSQQQVTCLWRKPVMSIGLSLVAFLALEADKPDLRPNETTASWERPQKTSGIQPSQDSGDLSLDQASTLALQVFAKAEEELQAEREAEARFLATLWQDELL